MKSWWMCQNSWVEKLLLYILKEGWFLYLLTMRMPRSRKHSTLEYAKSHIKCAFFAYTTSQRIHAITTTIMMLSSRQTASHRWHLNLPARAAAKIGSDLHFNIHRRSQHYLKIISWEKERSEVIRAIFLLSYLSLVAFFYFLWSVLCSTLAARSNCRANEYHFRTWNHNHIRQQRFLWSFRTVEFFMLHLGS